MNTIERKWIDVILKTSTIYSDRAIENKTAHNDKKRKRVMDYLNEMEKYEKMCFINKGLRFERIYKNIFFYRKYIIKEDEIPDSYYESLYENGVIEKIDDKKKRELARSLIKDQKVELDTWINYFIYGNGRFYPMYEQFWAFQGLQKLGDYDQTRGVFLSRRKNRVNPVPRIDEAALEMTITLMEDYISKNQTIPPIENELKSYNFKGLYEYSVKEVTKRRAHKSKEGIWKTYHQGSDPTKLLDDIRGKYTGWCIERQSWAKEYLSKGDIYIFFTKDINGQYEDPRITIRMEEEEIKEIRGIGFEQNVEADVLDELDKKIIEFGYVEDYYKKRKNVETIAKIEKKVNANEELDSTELRFLYEIDDVIETFARESDIKIQNIKSLRNPKRDLSIIFNVEENEVATNETEIDEHTKVFYGSLEYYLENNKILMICNDNEYYVDKAYIPDYIVGNMTLKIPLEKMPELITGSFDLFCPKVIENLVVPHVLKHLSVYDLEEAENIIFKGNEIYDINFYSLKKVKCIIMPDLCKGEIKYSNITHFNEAKFPSVVKGDVRLPVLFDASSLTLPRKICGNLYIPNLLSKEGITVPETVEGKITCYNVDLIERGKKR